MKNSSEVKDCDLVLWFDGGFNWADGSGAYAWALSTVNGKVLRQGSGIVASADVPSPNSSEWEGLLNGILSLVASKKQPGKLYIHGDSALVIKQLKRRWKCHKPHLARYRDRCLKLLGGLKNTTWEARWVPRERNVFVDGLVRAEFGRLYRTSVVLGEIVVDRGRWSR
jgi:ribonuclease HI